MSLIASNHELRTILDFSKMKLSKNKVTTALRCADVKQLARYQDKNTFISNFISVGMYTISLHFTTVPSDKNRLKNYGRFKIGVWEKGEMISINLSRDKRFKSQYWAQYKSFRMKNLVDIIMFISRLDKLKLFL